MAGLAAPRRLARAPRSASSPARRTATCTSSGASEAPRPERRGRTRQTRAVRDQRVSTPTWGSLKENTTIANRGNEQRRWRDGATARPIGTKPGGRGLSNRRRRRRLASSVEPLVELGLGGHARGGRVATASYAYDPNTTRGPRACCSRRRQGKRCLTERAASERLGRTTAENRRALFLRAFLDANDADGGYPRSPSVCPCSCSRTCSQTRTSPGDESRTGDLVLEWRADALGRRRASPGSRVWRAGSWAARGP